MFQILIVDDEPSVVDAIAQTMPWDELHIDEVYCAYSSREALKIAELHYIDIVLTDIRMPGMDGMALIEAIRRTSERTRFILLTGYAEFEYAKQALKLQADDYLLKPVSDEKLQESIANVTRKLKEEWDQVTSMQRTMRVFREHLPAMRAELLRDILENRYSVRDLADKLPALNLNVQSGDTVAPMLIRLEGKFASYNRHDRFMIEYAILNIAEEIMGPHFSLWMCEDAHGYLVIAVTAKTAADEAVFSRELLMRLAAQLQHLVSHYLQGSISVVVGQSGRFPEQLPDLYEGAIRTMRTGIGADSGLLMEAGEPLPDANARPLANLRPLAQIYEPPSLTQLFEAGMWDVARSKLSDAFRKLEASGCDSLEFMQELYHAVCAASFHYAHVNGKTLKQMLGDSDAGERLDVLDISEGKLDLSVLKTWVFGLLDRFSRENLHEIRDVRSQIVARIQEYIHKHLADNVTLQALADHVHLHPAYLSKIYKLETKEGLKDYLLRVRMEKAKHLLLCSDLKIYEITEQIGYLNTAYFIKVFKKHFGKTPQEYREEHQT